MSRRCPAPTPIFIGCEAKIRQVESCIVGGNQERRLCVVHGLGGTGKTQLVRKVIERMHETWKEVIYIDASTQESIENTLGAAVPTKGAGDTYKNALQWLESYHEPWLIVFDGADDSSFALQDYIPNVNYGSIVITTRLLDRAVLAQGPHSVCKVSGMDPDNALALLLKSSRRSDQTLSPKEMENARALLKELGYLGLAIVQAGTFIGQSLNMSITEYRSYFLSHRQEGLETYNEFPSTADDYGHTVYTTWLMSYAQLQPQAQELLWLIAFLPQTLSINLFRRAASGVRSYEPNFPVTPLENSAQEKVQKFLSTFLDAKECWDELAFADVINEITSHSLLEYDQINQSYSIHVLVQDWARTIIPFALDLASTCAKALLSASIPLGCSSEAINWRIQLGPHVDFLLSNYPGALEINHAYAFATVYQDVEQWDKLVQLQEPTREAAVRTFGEGHPKTLKFTSELAETYNKLAESHFKKGQYHDAENMAGQALNGRKQVLGEDHSDTLASMATLAVIYLKQGKLNEESSLNLQVFDTRKRVLGETHPDTLKSANNLAASYFRRGRLDEAEALVIHVRECRQQMLGKDHPDTLTSMANLAAIYSEQGKLNKAEALNVQVLNTRKKMIGEDHPDILTSMVNLAATYFGQDRYLEAETLLIRALDRRKQMLGEEHPDTLTIMAILAVVYLKQGKLNEAELLNVQVLATRKRILGVDHPDTLASMINLAASYSSQGRRSDAKALEISISDSRKRIFGKGPQQMSKSGQPQGMSGQVTGGGRLSETQQPSKFGMSPSDSKKGHTGNGGYNQFSQNTSQRMDNPQSTSQKSRLRQGINILCIGELLPVREDLHSYD
ncbi:hypothetical protein ACGC1H_003304 [Rhizoctonia solani]